jgi:hypothetical protein
MSPAYLSPCPGLHGPGLGVLAVRRMRGKGSTLLRFHIEHAFRRYFAVVFPLPVIAAGIETALIPSRAPPQSEKTFFDPGKAIDSLFINQVFLSVERL